MRISAKLSTPCNLCSSKGRKAIKVKVQYEFVPHSENEEVNFHFNFIGYKLQNAEACN
jgi:hypothetical protein